MTWRGFQRGDLVMTRDGFIGRIHFIKKSGKIRVHVPPHYRVGSEYFAKDLFPIS
jgi:hypothetical protein